MSDDDFGPRLTRGEAIAKLTADANELYRIRDLIELFDVRGWPKPSVPVGDGKWARSPIAVLHELGFDQRRDPTEWRAYLHSQFPHREQILAHVLEGRERTLRMALGSHLLSVRQTKCACAELEEIRADRRVLDTPATGLRKAA